VWRGCYVDARRRRLLLARRERAGLLAEKAERCAEDDRRDDGWPGVLDRRDDGMERDVGVRAGSAEPRPWRASSEEASGGERKEETSSPRRTSGGAPAAVRRVGGRDRGEKVGDGRKKLRVGRLFSLKFRTGVTKKKHRGRPDAWDRLKRRRWALHTLGADAYAQRALAGGAAGRAGPSGGRVRGALARSRWAAKAGPQRGAELARASARAGALAWELGRGASGPTREGGGRWAERGGERGKKARVGWPNGPGKGRLGHFPFFLFQKLFFPLLFIYSI
jgi:hypothetical protein